MARVSRWPALAVRRNDRRGGMLQLLSRARTSAHGAKAARSRTDDDELADVDQDRCAITGASRTTRISEYRLQRAARRDPGGGAAGQAGAAGESGTRRRRKLAELYRERLDGRRRAAVGAEGWVLSITCLSIRSRKRDAIRQALLRTEDRMRNSLSDAAASAAGVPRSRLPARGFSREPSAGRHRACRSPMHPHLTMPRSTGGRNGSGHEARIKRIRRRASPKSSYVRTPPACGSEACSPANYKDRKRFFAAADGVALLAAFGAALAHRTIPRSDDRDPPARPIRRAVPRDRGCVFVWIMVFQCVRPLPDARRRHEGTRRDRQGGCAYAALLTLMVGFLAHLEASRLTVGAGLPAQHPGRSLLGRAVDAATDPADLRQSQVTRFRCVVIGCQPGRRATCCDQVSSEITPIRAGRLYRRRSPDGRAIARAAGIRRHSAHRRDWPRSIPAWKSHRAARRAARASTNRSSSYATDIACAGG